MADASFFASDSTADLSADSTIDHSSLRDCGKSEKQNVGQVRHSHIEDEWLQELLAYAARCPLPVRDVAGGFPHETLPGVFMVPLANADGLFALIDAEDYPLVRRLRWRTQAGSGYVFASDQAGSESPVAVFLHRLILMVGKSVQVDHRNGDLLDNRKSNLRPCTHIQNGWNAALSKRNTSGVKGVYWKADVRRWVGQVVANGVRYSKKFLEMPDAIEWTMAKRIEVHGEFACHGERDLDEGLDYFQAQGVRGRATLEGRIA